jgi:hypothetical protein
MLLGQILRIWEWSAARRVLAVLVSAAAAFLVTVGTTPLVQMPMAAGITQIGLMQEEHSLMADYLSSRAEADRQAILAETRERDDMRAAGVPAAVATAIPLPKPAKPVRLAASAKADVAADPLPSMAATPPLPLQSAASVQRAQPAQKGARGVLATVERMPRWAWAAVQNAADWAIIGPVQTIARLPERRFL